MSTNIEDIVKKQRDWFFSPDRKNDAKARKQRLKKLRQGIKAHEQEIIAATKLDLGKHSMETMLMEIKPVFTEIRTALNHLEDWMRYERVGSPLALITTKNGIQKSPKGTCLIMGPWNFPMTLLISPLVHAIAAGNTVVLKPSEIASKSADVIESIIKSCFDENEIAIVLGDADIAQELLKQRFDHVFFTGSPTVGRKVLEASVKHLNSTTLELGGANPVIIDETANLQDAARKIIWGKFLNYGQICMAPNYLVVHESKYSAFKTILIDELKNELENKEGRTSRIINTKHLERLEKLLKSYSSKYPVELYRHRLGKENSLYFPASIVEVTDLNEPLLQEEIFGPIIPLLSYSSKEELMSSLNQFESPLIAYLFTKSSKSRRWFTSTMRAGNIGINETILNFGHPELPFGGFGNSGIGLSHGKYGFEEFSNIKSVVKQRIGWTTVVLVSRPFTPFKQWIANVLAKRF